ncbi:MAG: DUF6677 family protein [Candidatus Hodarchaeales archaeon]
MSNKIKKDPTLAGILSFLIPGLGQIYAGNAIKGILFFIATFGGMFLIIPGIVFWIISIFDAVSEAKKG